MQMTPVFSSAIHVIGYDPQTRRMKITFAQGHAYDYSGAPENIFKWLLHSDSKGAYYNQYIKDRYQC